jgi:hypothetical protein
VPQTDGWGTAFEIASDAAGVGYTLGSAGKDKAWVGVTGDGGKTTNFDTDIVFINGQFVQWPEGIQN